MRGRPKKRKSTEIYETVPNLKQRLIGPSPRRTIKDRHPIWSSPNMRQQSITQMDALRDYYHPDIENEWLKTDDEEDSYVASPTRNKRLKVTPEKPRRIETRRAKRQAAEEEPSSRKRNDQDHIRPIEEEAKASISMPSAMLPPKTPISLRKKEIPSSQSPADTPLSTQSRRSLQDYARSPLKERSTNFELPIKTPVKGARWSKGLEVADSMETEYADSPVPVRAALTCDPVGPITEPEDNTEVGPPKPFDASAIHVDDFNERLKAAQRPVQEVQNSSQTRSRKEVVDSTDEDDDDDEEEAEAEAFTAGPETQAALASTEISQKSSGQAPESTLSTTTPIQNESEPAPVQRIASESPHLPNAPSPSPARETIEDQPPTQRPKRVEFVNLASSDPPAPPSQSQLSSITHPFDPTEVSAQLLADLHRETQPHGLQTESQFEMGWVAYTPANDNDDDDDPSDIDLIPSSPPQPTEQPSSSLMTVPTHLIRPPISTPPKYYRAPVPPSQATTVDVTQPSPRGSFPSSAKAVVAERSPPRILPPSSPPPVPPASSSPLAARKADPWEGYVWNGVRLTDSQLLPDSLMDDSQIGPPGLSQDIWVEEV